MPPSLLVYMSRSVEVFSNEPHRTPARWVFNPVRCFALLSWDDIGNGGVELFGDASLSIDPLLRLFSSEIS